MVSLQVELTRGEEALIDAKDTDNLEAWSKFSKGYNFWIKFTKEDNKRALKLVEDAVKLDPNYASAWALIGECHFVDVANGFSDSPFDSLKLAHEASQKALAIDDQHPYAFALQGTIHLLQRQYDKAIAKTRKSIEIDPNYYGGHCCLERIMLYVGRFEESIELINKAIRLCPNYHPMLLYDLGRNYFFLDRYEKAIPLLNQLDARSKKGECPTWWAPSFLAIVYEELGREEEARAYMAEALKIDPNLSLDYIKSAEPFKNPTHLQRMLDTYRKAGMPEKPPGAVP